MELVKLSDRSKEKKALLAVIEKAKEQAESDVIDYE